jgi:beta-mannosidase
MQNTLHDLSTLNWTLTGYLPNQWDLCSSAELGENLDADVRQIPAAVPCSVQKSLLDAGLIPDWNQGDNYRLCEWVENRQWLFETELPDEWLSSSPRHILKIDGLDYKGRIFVNSTQVYSFDNAFVSHEVELTRYLDKSNNTLKIIFDCPPRWLGQYGYTSKINDWKPRYNYTWDWTRRLVQTGIFGSVSIEGFDSVYVRSVSSYTDYDYQSGTGELCVFADAESEPGLYSEITLFDADQTVFRRTHPIDGSVFSAGGLKVCPWWPNGLGSQKLYHLRVRVYDGRDNLVKEISEQVGFKKISWENCHNTPAGCDPWICRVNGSDIFIQGVNWTPIRPNYADLREQDYRLRLNHYKEMGFNLIRIWGGGIKEPDCLYDICDELGLMVWQEFPLCSSGIDNSPPSDRASIEAVTETAVSYLKRLQRHVSISVWCGGNELQTALDGSPGIGLPLDSTHPMLESLEEAVMLFDPQRRFMPTSPIGPRFNAHKESFNQNLHWNVHGPWKAKGYTLDQWQNYWHDEDSHFRAEMGIPGSSSADIIKKYKGSFEPLPVSLENPLWSVSSWWIEDQEFIDEHGRCPLSIEEYVQWGQKRQADYLCTALNIYKSKFPRVGGFIIWMGHDSYPCPANTSLIDFEGNLKPAAVRLKHIFLKPANRAEYELNVR